MAKSRPDQLFTEVERLKPQISPKTLTEVEKCLIKMIDVVKEVNKFQDTVGDSLKAAQKKFIELNRNAKSDKSTAIAIRDTRTGASKGLLNADCWTTMRTEVIEDVMGGIQSSPQNLIPLKKIVTKLVKCFNHSAEISNSHTDRCSILNKTVAERADKCTDKASEANTSAFKTKAIGGLLSATAIGAGITASIVAGAFTFGIGTAIGLGVTGAAVGAGGAVATHKIASSYEQERERLLALVENFGQIELTITEIHAKIKQLESDMGHVEILIEDAFHSMAKHETELSVILALQRLHSKISELYVKQTNTSSYLRQLIN